MFRSRFFWKLYGTYAALVVGTTLVIGVLVHEQMRRSLVAEVERTLEHHALMLAPYGARRLSGEVGEQEQRRTNAFVREAGVRITLIGVDGKVLQDSHEDPATMVNHESRPEVRAALARGMGMAQRASETVGYEMIYVARAIRAGATAPASGVEQARPPAAGRDAKAQGVGVLRVALPVKTVLGQLRGMRLTLGVGAGIGVMAALLVGIVVARRITAPMVEMTEAAEGMRAGNYARRVAVRGRDEIGVLGDTLNRLGREVTRQIAALTQERAQLKAMVAGMVEGVLAVDEEDRLLFSNRAAARLLGTATGEANGRRVWEVARLAELPKLLSAARHGGPVHEEVTLHHGDPERVLEVHVTKFDGGQTRGLVIVLHDITNLRRLERIRRDFVANVSHELKTPLTSIKGYVETLLGGAIEDEQNNVRFLEKIDKHVERLTNLVQDLLSLARIESQEGSLRIRPVDCREIVGEAVSRHELTIKQHGLQCTAEVNGSPLVVLGDSEAITQILDNLLDNAVKYTPASGEVRVRLRRTEGHACVEVEDTGIGIPKKDLARVFERFYRVDRARSRELGGTGLGLSIVKHLAQAMQGEVRVESEVGKGSRFSVYLPLR